MAEDWAFVHNRASDAAWTEGLRKIFEYRDLGVNQGTDGDFVAHVIRATGRDDEDNIHEWHYHECNFQMVYILSGWAKFEYEDVGIRTLKAGDCVNQLPGIKHREIECSVDVEMLEIVSPADFRPHTIEAP